MTATRFLLIDIAEVAHDDHFDGIAGLIGPMPEDEAHALAHHYSTHEYVLRVHIKDMSLNDTHLYEDGGVHVVGRRMSELGAWSGFTKTVPC